MRLIRCDADGCGKEYELDPKSVGEIPEGFHEIKVTTSSEWPGKEIDATLCDACADSMGAKFLRVKEGFRPKVETPPGFDNEREVVGVT